MSGLFGALRLPASVVIGSGQRGAIAALAARFGNRALVCTDERMSRDIQFRGIVEALQAQGVQSEIYDRTEADLPIDGIGDCVDQFGAFKPSVILGIGGGSCMDMAKCVALQLTHKGSLARLLRRKQDPLTGAARHRRAHHRRNGLGSHARGSCRRY